MNPLSQFGSTLPPTSLCNAESPDSASGEVSQSVTPLIATLLEAVGGAPFNQSIESAGAEGADGAGGVDEVIDDIQSKESVEGTEVADDEPSQSVMPSIAGADDLGDSGG